MSTCTGQTGHCFNAHADAYVEEILNKETVMSKEILKALPKEMRKNFFNTVLSFMRIRQQEVTIQADYAYENLKLIPTIENPKQKAELELIKDYLTYF